MTKKPPDSKIPVNQQEPEDWKKDAWYRDEKSALLIKAKESDGKLLCLALNILTGNPNPLSANVFALILAQRIADQAQDKEEVYLLCAKAGQTKFKAKM